MPRYYFHTRIGGDLIRDSSGEELRHADQAWEVAKALVEELLREQDFPNLLAASLEITNEAGEIVLEFPFSEVLLANPDVTSTTH